MSESGTTEMEETVAIESEKMKVVNGIKEVNEKSEVMLQNGDSEKSQINGDIEKMEDAETEDHSPKSLINCNKLEEKSNSNSVEHNPCNGKEYGGDQESVENNTSEASDSNDVKSPVPDEKESNMDTDDKSKVKESDDDDEAKESEKDEANESEKDEANESEKDEAKESEKGESKENKDSDSEEKMEIGEISDKVKSEDSEEKDEDSEEKSKSDDKKDDENKDKEEKHGDKEVDPKQAPTPKGKKRKVEEVQEMPTRQLRVRRTPRKYTEDEDDEIKIEKEVTCVKDVKSQPAKVVKEVKEDQGSDIEMIEESDPLAISDADVKKAQQKDKNDSAKKDQNVIIIDTNTLMKNQGNISAAAAITKPTTTAVTVTAGAGRSITTTASSVSTGTTSSNITPNSITNVNIQTAIQAITGGVPAQGLQSAYITALQQVLLAQGGQVPMNSQHLAQLQQYYNSLGHLQDDAYVIEAPSFIVPYVMEGKPKEPIKEFLKKINKELQEFDANEKKKKEEGEKEKEKPEKDKDKAEKDKDKAEKDKDKVEKDKDKAEKDKDKEEKDKDEDDEEEEKKDGDEEKVDDEEKDDDKEKSEDEKEEKCEVKKEEKDAESDDSDKKGEDKSEDKENETTEEDAQSDKAEKEEEEEKEESKADIDNDEDKENQPKDDPDADIVELDKEEKKEDEEDLSHLGKWEPYYRSALGKFILDLGLNQAQEFLQSDLLRMQKKKYEKLKTNPSKESVINIKVLEKQLAATKKKNGHLRVPLKTCKFCNFKTESEMVMDRHLESPHMVNYTYKCNFCDFETRGPQVILFHMEAEHNIRGRLERAPAFFQCSLCPYEDNNKSKMTRHSFSCSKKFKPEKNCDLADWEPPAKIPKVQRGRPNTLGKAFEPVRMPTILPKGLQGMNVSLQNAVAANLLSNASINNLAAGRGRGRPVGSYKTTAGIVNQGRGVTGMTTSGRLVQSVGGNTQQFTLGNQMFHLVNGHLVPMSGAASSASSVSVSSQSSRVPRILPSGSPSNISQFPGLAASSSITIQSVQNKAGNTKSPQQPSISITPLPRGGQGAGAAASTSQNMTKGATPTRDASGKPSFVICEICDGYIKDLEQLRNHMNLIHKVKIHPKMIYNRPPLNCQKCQHRFFTDQGLERHLLGTHGLVTSSMQEAANKGKDAGRCPICGKVFQWKLLNHVSRDHKMTLKPAHLSYKCTVCTATFNMYRLFENHVYSAHSVVNKNKGGDKKSSSSGGSSSSDPPLKINDEITIIPQPASKGSKPDNSVTAKKAGSSPSVSKEITITKVGSRPTRRSAGSVEVISLDESPKKPEKRVSKDSETSVAKKAKVDS